ncbi:MAG: PAS domain-containing protein, partial [Fimbriiglobus sp.]
VRSEAARRAALAAGYQIDLTVIADSLSRLGDPRATIPSTPNLSAPFPEAVKRAAGGFDAVARDLGTSRQRLNWMVRVLAALPDPVIVADGTGAPRYLNPAAEKLFGITTAAAGKGTLPGLIAATPMTPDAGEDPAMFVAGATEFVEWMRRGAIGFLVVRSASGQLVELAAAISGKATREGLICLIARDANAEPGRIASDRALVRATAVRGQLDLFLRESSEPLSKLNAQLRLLTGDAKQSGQRDAMLGRLTGAEQALRNLETYHMLAYWYRLAVWQNLGDSTPSEFMPSEVTGLVSGKLAARLKARGNALKVVDQGGWMFADADRLEAALTGLVTHASDASSNLQFELRIGRLPVSPQQPTPMTEFYLPDAGPMIAAGELAVVDRPFGSLAPPPIDRFADVGGCPLGLVVAHHLARSADGRLVLEAGPAGQLAIRLMIPTRRGDTGPVVTVAAAAPGALDVAPAGETVSGWRLGVPAAQSPA